jgi:hypothetical protein
MNKNATVRLLATLGASLLVSACSSTSTVNNEGAQTPANKAEPAAEPPSEKVAESSAPATATDAAPATPSPISGPGTLSTPSAMGAADDKHADGPGNSEDAPGHTKKGKGKKAKGAKDKGTSEEAKAAKK